MYVNKKETPKKADQPLSLLLSYTSSIILCCIVAARARDEP